MFRRVFLILLVSVVSTLAQDRHPHLTADQKKHILDGEFTMVRFTKEIPENVKRAFASAADQDRFAMADPGKPFQVTDVVTDRSLPWRRLIFAARDNGKWLVHYERGGIAHSYALLIFQTRADGTVDLIWGAATWHPAKDLDDLRTMLRQKKLMDDLPYAW